MNQEAYHRDRKASLLIQEGRPESRMAGRSRFLKNEDTYWCKIYAGDINDENFSIFS